MKTVCLLDGNMRERKGFLDKIKESLSDNELCIFDQNDYYDNVSQVVTELSCFGQRRLFVLKGLPQLRNAEKSKDAKRKARDKVIRDFKKLFPLIPMGNLVVFDNVGISAKSFFKEVEKYGSVHLFKQKISKRDAKKRIVKYFEKLKITVSNDVADLIANSLNLNGEDVDLDKLSLLLIKLDNYVYGKSTITEKDVYAICSTSKDFIVWSLYNILDGDDGDRNTRYSRSLKLITDFLFNARYFQFEATMLMKSMLWRYGLLLMARNGVENKISKKEIVDEISNIKKLKSKGKSQKIKMSSKDGKPEYSIKMINSIMHRNRGKETLSCYTFDELLLIYLTISKSLVKIRSGCTVSEIITFLQIILLTVCGELNVATSSDGILEHKKLLRG